MSIFYQRKVVQIEENNKRGNLRSFLFLCREFDAAFSKIEFSLSLSLSDASTKTDEIKLMRNTPKSSGMSGRHDFFSFQRLESYDTLQ